MDDSYLLAAALLNHSPNLYQALTGVRFPRLLWVPELL